MRFLKANWFGIFIGLIIFWFLAFFAIVAFAPREDVGQHGFVKCTNALAENIENCGQNKFFCTFNQILKNAGCDVEVIADGLKLWLNGGQERPWSNYYFTPVTADDVEDAEDYDGKAEYRKQNPGMADEMMKLKMLNEELNKNDE